MSNTNSDHTSKEPIDQRPTSKPDAAAQNKDGTDEILKGDTRVDISTADDINVDEDNAIGSPKNSLTATESDNTDDGTVDTSPAKNPDDKVTPGMTAYAIAVIRETQFNDEVVKYLQSIDETLAPFSGKYVVHGGPCQPLEGSWKGDLVIIQFPSMENAQAWYNSDAYESIRHLRTRNTEGDVVLVQGVQEGHKGADILK